MSLQEVSFEELLQEIERRNFIEQTEIQRQLDDARQLVRELETKLRELKTDSIVRPSVAPFMKVRFSLTEKTEKILTCLAGRDFSGVGEIAGLVGCSATEVPTALRLLVSSGKIIRVGQRRGTRYKLA